MNRSILRLAIPNILSNLTVPLLSSVDTALMGHLDAVSYLGAIAIGGMIFNFVYWGFGFLRMGTTGFTAQAYGKTDRQESISILLRALILALTIGILILLIRPFILYISFLLINTTEQVQKNATVYFNIRIFAAPATLAIYVFSGWFLGMQNAKYPLYLAVTTNILNIGFNFLFIYGYNMNVDGVAWGTVCANYAGLMLAVMLWIKKYSSLQRFISRKQIFDLVELRRFFSINRDIFLRTLMLIFTFAFFTAKSSEISENILAVNAILINLWTVMSYAIDGFAFASESLVGKFYGAKNKEKLIRSIRYSFYWGIGLGLGFSVIYALFSHPILSIFTDKNRIIQLAQVYIIWTIIAPPINSICYLLDGIFIGATAASAMRNAMLLSLFLIYLPTYYLCVGIVGNHALWLSLTAFMLARAVFLGLYLNKEILDKA
jgi:MATE family multidrug resistance protein